MKSSTSQLATCAAARSAVSAAEDRGGRHQQEMFLDVSSQVVTAGCAADRPAFDVFAGREMDLAELEIWR